MTMTINPMDLSGKRILITGASSGIGRACAILTARLGASVVISGRRSEALADTLKAFPSADGHLCVSDDLSTENAATRIVNSATAEGRLDGVVHAAGLELAAPIKMTDMSEARRLYEVNCLAFLELVKVCTGRRYANPGFSAVAVSSIAAFAGWNGVSAYAASKGGISACVRALAIELAPKGFRVNAVCPSNIKTPMFDRLTESLDEAHVRTAVIQKQPLGIGMPEQVASAVCFLLSQASSFITGVNLPVDGGYLAQ